MAITLREAADMLGPFAASLEAVMTLSKSRALGPADLVPLHRALDRAQVLPGAAVFGGAIQELRSLLSQHPLTPENTDASLQRINALVQSLVQARPRLGPSNPGRAADWYRAALGSMGQALSKLAFIEYVRTKAGNFGAGQTAGQSMRTVEDARNLLSWIEQSPEENTAPVPEP